MEVEARGIFVTGETCATVLSPHVPPGTGCTKWWQCQGLSECEIMWWLSHYASFINAPCHLSLLTSFLTIGKQSGASGEAIVHRGGRDAVVAHLEWDSNQPAAAMETGGEPPHIL